MDATIELDREVPVRAREILAALPGLTVLAGQAANTLRADGRSWPLAVLSGGLRPFAHATVPMLKAFAGDKLPFVVADRLPEHVRKELESAGCAYADGTGAAHVKVPGLYLHIEGRPSRRHRRELTPPGLGVVAVRAIQSLLTDPARTWSVPDLAQAAGCSAGEAHRVLTRLQAEDLLAAAGRARSLRRTVANPGALLDWLSTVPSARRIRERRYAFLYTPDQSALPTYISAAAVQHKLVFAFTGVAAAHIYGAAVTTTIPVTMLRIAPDVSLDEACIQLRAEPVDTGPNLVLVRDLGEVGVHGRQFNGPAPLAPPARVWLDMLDEPRGEDAAALFREAVIGW